MKSDALPICVDLDGTLVRTNTLLEAILVLLKQNPLYFFSFVGWLARGKVYFKCAVARQSRLPVAHLPYNQTLLAYLKEQQAGGSPLYLLTAASREIAEAVASHLGIFTAVIASDMENLKGVAKAAVAVERFGEKKFLYAGNEQVDVAVWSRSAGAIVVTASANVAAAAARVAPVVRIIPRSRVTWWTISRLLRCHQWVKNVLVFVPMVAAHTLFVDAMTRAGLAFVAFCITSSSVYVLNDLLDLFSDRTHPTKWKRPFASGDVPLHFGLILFPLLLVAGLLSGYFVSVIFLSWLVAYWVLTIAYSFHLKRLVIVDVLVLGLLYTLRIFAGAAAVAVTVSAWLLVFSLFLFMSLALLKRFTELMRLSVSRASPSLSGRGYRVTDTAPIGGLGMVSGYLSVLVLALYISSEEITRLYEYPHLLWLLVPILMYWISRLWLLAYRDEVHDDPVVFAMRDSMSYILLGMSLLIVLIAT